jgi:predicted nucleic acid-binding protein
MVYDLARRIFPLVIPVDGAVTDRARELMDRYRTLSARDAVHAAVVQVHDLQGICSYDDDFDLVEELIRIQP